ncbi:MAG: hypothetical protein QNJ65_15610 [Xenococcaceae cyanobacterium MO_234.B1]|nr:hypothetical protein [Xenococcaceae cyanobacterium MO_234.B1]
MSGEQLNLRPFQSGQYTFAGIEQAGLVYRFSPVERRDIITIGSLTKNEPKEIDLSTQLQHDILVTGISADIVDDDSHLIQEGRSNYKITYVQTILQLLDRNNRNVLRTISLFLSGYTPSDGELILSPKPIYQVKTNLAVRSISITGKPVYVNTALVYL